MNELDQILKAGSLLIIETGAYSDRSWNGPVRLLKEATKRDMAEAYREQPVMIPASERHENRAGRFPATQETL